MDVIRLIRMRGTMNCKQSNELLCSRDSVGFLNLFANTGIQRNLFFFALSISLSLGRVLFKTSQGLSIMGQECVLYITLEKLCNGNIVFCHQDCLYCRFHYNWFLVNDQRDAQILFHVFISVYNSLHVSSTQCSSSGETNCINTASGNSHSMLMAEMCAGEKNLCITLVIYQESLHDAGQVNKM